jgi:hypothetical protein
MAEITYYVALPFVAADDGIAAGNATPKHWRADLGHVGAVAFSRTGTRPQAISATQTIIRSFGEVLDLRAL